MFKPLISFCALVVLAFYAAPVKAEPCEGFEATMAALEQSVLRSNAQSLQQSVAPSPLGHTEFVQAFTTPEEIKLWARNSAAGGGNIQQLELGGRHLIFATRSHTSPFQNSDMGVYQYDGARWVLVKTFPPVKGRFTAANLYDDRIEFESEYGALISLAMPSG